MFTTHYFFIEAARHAYISVFRELHRQVLAALPRAVLVPNRKTKPQPAPVVRMMEYACPSPTMRSSRPSQPARPSESLALTFVPTCA